MSGYKNRYMIQQRTKREHMKKIVLELLYNGPRSRTALARALDVSLTAASALAEEELALGLLRAGDKDSASSAGRPPELLELRGDAVCFPVIATKRRALSVAVYDLRLELAFSAELPYENIYLPENLSDGLYSVTADSFAALLARASGAIPRGLLKKAPALILSMPGGFRDGGEVFRAVPLSLEVRGDFVSALRELVGAEVVLGNDSDYLAYSEKPRGGAADECCYIYANIHYGVGAGIIYRGNFLHNSASEPVELGHLSIDYRGPECGCGGRGCLERYIAFGSILERTGFTHIAEAAEAYLSGVPAVEAVMEDTAEKLVYGLSSLLAVFSAEEIILGGGIECFGEKFLALVKRKFRELPLPRIGGREGGDIIRYPSVKKLGEQYGAARWCVESYWEP